MNEDRKPDVTAQVLSVIFSRGLTRVGQLVAFALLARALTPAEFGRYGILTSTVFVFAQLGNLGLQQASAYVVGRGVAKAGRVAGTLLLLWPLSVLGTVGLIAYFQPDTLSSTAELSAVAAAVAGFLLITSMQGIFLGRGDVGRFAFTDAMPRVISSIASVGLFAVGWLTYPVAVLAFALGFAIAAPVATRLATKEVGELKPALADVPGLLRYGVSFAIALFLVYLNTRVGLFFLQQLEGAEAAGNFFAAQRATEIILEVATAVSLVLFSTSVRSESIDEVLASSARVVRLVIWVFGLGGVVAACAAPFFVNVLVGSAYAQAGPILQVLVLGLAPAAAIKLLHSAFTGAGRVWLGAAVLGISAALNAVLCALLIPRIGAYGAPCALVSAHALGVFIYITAAHCLYKVSPLDFLWLKAEDIGGILIRLRRKIGELEYIR